MSTNNFSEYLVNNEKCNYIPNYVNKIDILEHCIICRKPNVMISCVQFIVRLMVLTPQVLKHGIKSSKK